MERAKGIEPSASAWEAEVLPLYDARSGLQVGILTQMPAASMQPCSGQLPVLAGVEQQRGEVRGFAEAFDLADEDGVVTAGMGSLVGHFEHRAAAGEDRGAAGAGLPGQADETVGRPGGEAVGEVHLRCREDVDGVVAGAAEGFQAVRVVIQAPEYQRRLERDGREGIDGQADRPAVRVERRDDGDPGGEAPEGVAQGTGVVGNLGHGGRTGRGRRKTPYYPCSRSPRRGRI